MSLFNLANILNTSTNKIQNMIDNTQMKVRLHMKLESDVDILEKFLKIFKPKILYIHIRLPNKINDDKLKKLLISMAELKKKVKPALKLKKTLKKFFNVDYYNYDI